MIGDLKQIDYKMLTLLLLKRKANAKKFNGPIQIRMMKRKAMTMRAGEVIRCRKEATILKKPRFPSTILFFRRNLPT